MCAYSGGLCIREVKPLTERARGGSRDDWRRWPWVVSEEWPGGEESQGAVRGEIFLDFHVFPSPFTLDFPPCSSTQKISWSLVEPLRAGEMPDFWHNLLVNRGTCSCVLGKEGMQENTQIMSVGWHWSCHFHSWVGNRLWPSTAG